MSTNEICPLLDTAMLLGETPLWHPEESALFWIDIAGQSVHRFCPADGTHRYWKLPAEPGCVAYISVGKLLVAMRSGLAELDTTSGALTHFSDPPYDPSNVRFNDGRCDAHGRLWAGSLYDSRERPGGSLFCVERGSIRDIRKPVTVSNGVAFSCDHRTLYHTDTTAHRIMAYDFDIETGEVGGSRLFKQFSSDKGAEYGGRPDGAAVDSENAYWCAMYEGGRLLRIAPDGEILRDIALPVRCPTMIAFGGEDMKSLYITTVRHNRPADELARHPLSGHVLTMRVDVPGQAEFAYRP